MTQHIYLSAEDIKELIKQHLVLHGLKLVRDGLTDCIVAEAINGHDAHVKGVLVQVEPLQKSEKPYR